jgi:pimeloyl-ACP methyl ester carboxylesterase
MPFSSVRGRRWHYVERGAGFPLLLGHSYLWDHGMWSGLTSVLSKHFHCFVPDLWSHGQTDPLPDKTITLDILAQDHRVFMESLGIPRYGVIGLSVGGMWGMRLALSHPERVAALVLMNTAAGMEPDLPRMRYNGMLDQVEKAGTVPLPVQQAIQPFFFSQETLQDNPALSAGFMASLSQVKPTHAPGIVALGRTIFGRESILPRLERVSCPSLVVAGEHDRSRPPQEAEMMAREIPGARCEVIAGVGHMSILEAPLQISRLISVFLKEALSKESFL